MELLKDILFCAFCISIPVVIFGFIFMVSWVAKEQDKEDRERKERGDHITW